MKKNKINIQKWKEFNICDLFDIRLSSDDLQPGKLNNGEYPLVSSGKNNNGIVMYIEKQEESTLYKKNTITIDMFGKCFFQNNDYYCVSHGRVNILIPKFKINRNIGLFLACTIEKNLSNKYSFIVMCSSSLLKKEKIKLPVDINSNPDWEYIDVYMDDIYQKTQKAFDILNNNDGIKKKCNTTEWKEFKVGKIFNIISPKVYHTREVKESNIGIPYVVRSKYNNGIKYFVEKDEKFILNPKNVISFGAENASFFYQEKEYISGRDMYYIDTRNITKESALFIITCLEKISQKYSYNFGLFPKLLKEEKVKLPVTPDGKPNFEYMDKYMSNLLKINEQKIKFFHI